MSATSPNDTDSQLPSFTITLDGSPLDSSFVVLGLNVWKNVNKVSRASITILAGDTYMGTFEESESANFAPGVDVVISMGYDQTNIGVFTGVLVKHAISVKRGYETSNFRSLLVLECVDKAVKMTLAKHSEIYEQKKDSDIITTLLSEYGLSKTVEASTFQHSFMAQYNVSDWDFMVKRAHACGMVVLNSDNSVDVKKPKVTTSSIAVVVYGESAISFEAEIDASTQLKATSAKTWDPFRESLVTQTGSEPAGMSAPGNLTGATLSSVVSPASWDLYYSGPLEADELKLIADAAMIDSRLKRVRGNVVFRGMSNIALGTIITLSGFGARFDGDVFVTGVEHELSDGNFTTKVGFGLPKQFFGDATFGEESPLLNPIRGMHVGIVKNIDGDPDDGYRIQVQIPALKQSGNGLWARLTQFFATKDAGSFFIPEVNSEVVVGFLNDDPRFPVVLGCLYDTNNKPYTTFTADNSKKAIVTTNKLTLEFNDEDKVITLKTPGGNSIVINDKDKGITIEDQNGNSVKTSSSGITINSSKAINITSSQKVTISGGTGVDISASGGDVGLKGLNVNAQADIKFSGKGTAQAELTASGQVVVKGAIVMIN
jgi:Rhs element Vgr protein